MNKIIIEVPEYVEYISQWAEYQCPLGHCIIDKTVTGCGFTEFCLRNNENVILCSPRKVLLENKEGQHHKKGNFNILYLRNDSEKIIEFDKSSDDRCSDDKDDISNNYSAVLDLKERTLSHYTNCLMNLQKPCKILVTYDSLKYILDALGSSINNFRVVVDEFQSIFLDSYFKSDVELDFVEYLKDCHNVLYLSATPMLDRYLDQLDYFRDLPYYELQWSPNYVEKIKVQRKQVKSLVTDTGKIIQDYKNGKFPQKIDNEGNIYLSKELVIFCNSVSMITQLIKRNNLNSNEVNIICSKTPKNERKLKKIKHIIGTIPLEGQSHKMFTFCTRTTYLGADFYSPCASTIILSDANIESMALDISLDLPQIIGRQRLKENVFKNDIIIFYKTLRDISKITREDFEKYVLEKRRKTSVLLEEYQKMSERGKIEYSEKLIRDSKLYQYDLVAVSRKTGYAILNYLVEVSDWRAWEVAQIDYQDNLSVTRSIYKILNGEICEYKDENTQVVDNFLQEFYSIGDFRLKMRLYCEFRDIYSSNKEISLSLHYKISDQRFENYYNYYGTDRIKSLRYEDKPLREGIQNKLKQDPLSSMIYQIFQISQKYTLKEIKERLGEIYISLGITKTPKASDLEEYYETKSILISENNGKRQKGYELLKFK